MLYFHSILFLIILLLVDTSVVTSRKSNQQPFKKFYFFDLYFSNQSIFSEPSYDDHMVYNGGFWLKYYIKQIIEL